MADKRFYSTIEVAKLLKISRIAVFKRIKSGKLKAEKIGRNYIISVAEVKKMLEQPMITVSATIIKEKKTPRLTKVSVRVIEQKEEDLRPSIAHVRVIEQKEEDLRPSIAHVRVIEDEK